MNDKFREKYLKYKKKYLALRGGYDASMIKIAENNQSIKYVSDSYIKTKINSRITDKQKQDNYFTQIRTYIDILLRTNDLVKQRNETGDVYLTNQINNLINKLNNGEKINPS